MVSRMHQPFVWLGLMLCDRHKGRNHSNLSRWVEGKLAGAAALSTGVTKDLDSCRKDILAFLQMLRWRVVSVEVKLWTAFGLPHGTRAWETDGTDYETFARRVR